MGTRNMSEWNTRSMSEWGTGRMSEWVCMFYRDRGSKRGVEQVLDMFCSVYSK